MPAERTASKPIGGILEAQALVRGHTEPPRGLKEHVGCRLPFGTSSPRPRPTPATQGQVHAANNRLAREPTWRPQSRCRGAPGVEQPAQARHGHEAATRQPAIQPFLFFLLRQDLVTRKRAPEDDGEEFAVALAVEPRQSAGVRGGKACRSANTAKASACDGILSTSVPSRSNMQARGRNEASDEGAGRAIDLAIVRRTRGRAQLDANPPASTAGDLVDAGALQVRDGAAGADVTTRPPARRRVWSRRRSARRARCRRSRR